MNRYTTTYAAAIVAALIIAYMGLHNPQSRALDVLTLCAVTACAAIAMAAIHFAEKRAAANRSWTERASFTQIMVDVAVEYQAVRQQREYTARTARSHARAYINVRYAYLTKAERAVTLAYAIEYAQQHLQELHLHPIRDINARPSYA